MHSVLPRLIHTTKLFARETSIFSEPHPFNTAAIVAALRPGADLPYFHTSTPAPLEIRVRT